MNGDCTSYKTRFTTRKYKPYGVTFTIELDGHVMKYTIGSPVLKDNISENEDNDYFDVQLFTTWSQMSIEVYVVVLKKDDDIYYPWKEVWEKAEICAEMQDFYYIIDPSKASHGY